MTMRKEKKNSEYFKERNWTIKKKISARKRERKQKKVKKIDNDDQNPNQGENKKKENGE